MWHGFLDESRRGTTYLVVAVVVRPRELDGVRSALRRLVRAGQRRVHFKKESDSRRRELVARMRRMGLRAAVWTVRDSDDIRARRLCLSAAATWLQELGVTRLAVESCAHQDLRDRQTLAAVLEKVDDPFVYEHLRPAEDPVLWASDAVAWCFGAGGDWRQRVQPMLDAVVRLDQDPENAKPGNRPSGR
ncbi:hypothetical protein SAMN05216553_102439 [Lentzea fradiae]|uniref:DUF3800 domain-containing protein n=1 Tax=Lentzea fradiae TaxID=200378 RepID=A0A1G7MPQ5_9PSEU|nr:hypothetical protein [Lentzea fradiae]SDF63636.1 hypothetical protein SAMN05216553_102439 [Lentzea fradiae]